MKELKGKAREEFVTEYGDVLDSIAKAHANAGELTTSAPAQKALSDIDQIIRNGKGSDTFGFQPGHIQEVGMDTVFDRLQAARAHLDDNIDWSAIRRGSKSATPAEKQLMKVRSQIDQALKGGSESKIESDSLYKASRDLEDRFFKLVSDKDGLHEVSLAKLYGDNDRAVKVKTFLKEMEDFAARKDLPDEIRESTDAFVKVLKEGMETADDKRLYQEFSRKTRGPSGPSVERASNTLGKRNPAFQAIITPGSFLDLKQQLPELAKHQFGKTYSDLNPYEQQALLQLLSWRQSKAMKQQAISPQLEAAAWQKIREKMGISSGS